jgi:hypothetical protein
VKPNSGDSLHLATVGRLVRGTALMIPLCAWRACAQQPPLESVEALTVAPVEEIRLKSHGSDQQVILKNDRLFGVLANYTTVESQEQFRPLSAKTKFKLSMKTMSDPVTVSFLGALALAPARRA